jgi:hypothetical protein
MPTIMWGLKVNQEYADLLPKLSTKEYNFIKQSLKRRGRGGGLAFLRKYPIIVNTQGVILDGYHRFRACQELGLESKLNLDPYGFQYGREGQSHVEFAWAVEFNRPWWQRPSNESLTLSYKGGDNKIMEILFIVNCNMRRTSRKLNKFQRVELALKVKSILENIAADMAETSTYTQEKLKTHVPLVGPEKGIPTFYLPYGRQMQELGKLVGVGYNTVKMILAILDPRNNISEEVIQKVRLGQKKINEAFFEMLGEKTHKLQLKLEERKREQNRNQYNCSSANRWIDSK